MLSFVIRRVLWFIPTILMVSIVTFLLIHATPGSPFQPEGANNLRPEDIERIEKQYGLDKPLPVQYANYIWKAMQGDFGESYQRRSQQVGDIISRTFPTSFHLGVMALTFAAVGGVILGVLAAVNQNGPMDYFSVTLAVLFYSVPNFVLAILLILAFVFWIPGWTGLDFFNVGGWESPRDWILPTIALGAGPLAIIARYTRSSMIDVIRSDYVRTARAKGLAERKVIVKHVLKNALIPVVTLLGPLLAALATGSFFVEQVFAIPGMGKFFIESMRAKDQPMILAVVLLYGVFLAIMNLLVDLAYGAIDPRIRLN
ncbi:MAG TPA: ABC transporter permease [Thermomicrobiales bacterium]|nr:ABC transporter permease [Thermomicrobiales bacterium]